MLYYFGNLKNGTYIILRNKVREHHYVKVYAFCLILKVDSPFFLLSTGHLPVQGIKRKTYKVHILINFVIHLTIYLFTSIR